MNPARSEIPSPLSPSVLGDATERYDVVVAGFGIAGGCAALEAARAGGRVLLLERAAVPGDHLHGWRAFLPRRWHGGSAGDRS